ncbi:hypothetical protein GY45DRAFT_284874 [Cubamyces sp. BRFM 1775]|nr:hypothetical protein GY45DRAFT_284874 [Cubamyces sp. BRFM 1775]
MAEMCHKRERRVGASDERSGGVGIMNEQRMRRRGDGHEMTECRGEDGAWQSGTGPASQGQRVYVSVNREWAGFGVHNECRREPREAAAGRRIEASEGAVRDLRAAVHRSAARWFNIAAQDTIARGAVKRGHRNKRSEIHQMSIIHEREAGEWRDARCNAPFQFNNKTVLGNWPLVVRPILWSYLRRRRIEKARTTNVHIRRYAAYVNCALRVSTDGQAVGHGIRRVS